MKPSHGRMYYWRIKGNHLWHFGYCTHLSDPGLILMGYWNGDTTSGFVLSWEEIETRPYNP